MNELIEIFGYKVFIIHGIYKYDPWNEETYIRNTDKYLPLPLKFRKILKEKYLQRWYVERSIFRFKKRIPMSALVSEPIEFTVARCPEQHTDVITICHPKDQFCRKDGNDWVLDRIKEALLHPHVEEWWKYVLKR